MSQNMAMGFNTASGKHCCNEDSKTTFAIDRYEVSIPQAVSTVATKKKFSHAHYNFLVSIPQAVSTVATKSIYR